jgi:ribosomal protein S18 acetylase RimI-like enzyme
VSAVTYRDATPDDAEAIADFARETWTATFGHLYPPEDLNAFLAAKYGADIQRREMAEGSRYLLAFDEAGIAGYCMMGALDMPVDDPRALELHRLYVHERAKGAGVAQNLMDEVIAWARGKGAPALYLSVWENNERAQRFYRRYGFADYSEWDFMVGTVADRDFIWRLAL